MGPTIIDSIQGIVQPVIVDLLLAATLGTIAWFMRKLPERWRIDIEAKHRDALHSALNTGVGLVIDTVQKHPGVLAPDLATTKIVDYVNRSVPDALKKLGPSRAQLEEMAQAKLQQQVDALLNRDRLAEALRSAGVDARRAG